MLLVVQRGHCYRTTGATGAPGEQEFATKTAARVEARVKALGHSVRIINADVSDVNYRGDAFVALHYDSSSSSSAGGASVGYQSPEGRKIAEFWKRHYVANGWNRGFRGDNYTAALAGYYGVRRAVAQGNRTAFISEAGFHSNPGDAALLAAPKGPDRVAIAIASAIVDIFGANCPKPSETKIPPFPGTVVRGDSGADVRAWQTQLTALPGYDLAVDGEFGPITENHVIWFQATHSKAPWFLRVDGIAGPATWHALMDARGFI